MLRTVHHPLEAVINALKKVDRIVKALCAMDAPIQSLIGHMDGLEGLRPRSCSNSAREIHKTFDDWQLIAQELYGACNNDVLQSRYPNSSSSNQN